MLSRKTGGGVSQILLLLITVILSHFISEGPQILKTKEKVDKKLKTRLKKTKQQQQQQTNQQGLGLKSQIVGDKKRMAASASKNQEVKNRGL